MIRSGAQGAEHIAQSAKRFFLYPLSLRFVHFLNAHDVRHTMYDEICQGSDTILLSC